MPGNQKKTGRNKTALKAAFIPDSCFDLLVIKIRMLFPLDHKMSEDN